MSISIASRGGERQYTIRYLIMFLLRTTYVARTARTVPHGMPSIGSRGKLVARTLFVQLKGVFHPSARK